MLHHQAVAKELILDLPEPWPAGRFAAGIESFLLCLAADLSLTGIIPGHIKAMVIAGDNYANFSCTKPGQVTADYSAQWPDSIISRPRLILNVVVMGLAEGAATAAVDKYRSLLPGTSREA